MHTVHTRKQTNENNNNNSGLYFVAFYSYFCTTHSVGNCVAHVLLLYCIRYSLSHSINSLWNELYIGKYSIYTNITYTVRIRYDERYIMHTYIVIYVVYSIVVTHLYLRLCQNWTKLIIIIIIGYYSHVQWSLPPRYLLVSSIRLC